MSTKFRLFIAALMAASAGAASAQSSSSSNSNYVGASVGLHKRYSIACDAGASCDRSASLGGKVYAGTMFDGFGVEALAFGLKSAQGSLNSGAGRAPGSVSMSGVGIVGVLPFTQGDFTLKGKLGLGYVRGKASIAGGVQDDSSVRPLLGAGVSYALNKQVSLNADLDRFSAKYSGSGKTHANMLSLGVSYKF